MGQWFQVKCKPSINIKNSVWIVSLCTLLYGVITSAQDQLITIGHFSMGEMVSWEEKSFAGSTQYQLKQRDGKSALYAHSSQGASGLFKEVEIDLKQTPYLSWQWLAENRLTGIDERTKQGDDYVARVYVVAKHPLFFWKTRALNYVWSSNQKVGSHWENAYTSQAIMIAVDGKTSPLNQWQPHKRNVYEDFKRYFGEEVEKVDVIAIMTDTDNSKGSATAWYGDISVMKQLP